MKYEGWEYKKLGEVCNFFRGLTYSKNDEVDQSDNRVLRSNNINLETHKINLEDVKCVSGDLGISENKKLKENSILICMSNGSHAHLGKTAFIPKSMNYAFGGFMGLVCPKDKSVFPKFCFYATISQAFLSYIEKLGNGANIKNLKWSDLQHFVISFPPLAEQQAIVEELDLLNAIIDKKKEELEELDKLAQSIFYDMFGDPVENEKGWEVKKWGELYDTILGKMLDQKKQVATDAQLPYLGNSNVLWGKFDLESLKTMSFSDKEIEKFRLEKNDLLICEGGESGRCAIWKTDGSNVLFQKAIHRARAKEYMIVPEYTMFWLHEFKKHGGLNNYVSKATIEHLTGKKLAILPIPLPPLPLQQQFATRISTIEQMKEKVSASMAEVQTLLAATMDKYFG